MDWIVALVALAAGLIIGWAVTFLLVRRFEFGRISEHRDRAQKEAARIVDAARVDSESLKRSAELEAKEEILRAKESWEKELTKRRAEVERTERRLDDREGLLDRKYSMLDEKHEQLEKRGGELEAREGAVDEIRE